MVISVLVMSTDATATWIILNRKSPVAPADSNKHKHGAVNVHFKVSGVHISLYLIFN